MGGVERINERGPFHDGREYPVDVLIYATGFKWAATATFNTIVGSDGRSLNQKYQEEGTKTFLGLHSHGFPNLFILSGPQAGGGAGFNFTEAIVSHTDYVVELLSVMQKKRVQIVDVQKEREDAWAAHCADVDVKSSSFRDCISYYNGHGEGKPGEFLYYGSTEWWKERNHALRSLSPYVFEAITT